MAIVHVLNGQEEEHCRQTMQKKAVNQCRIFLQELCDCTRDKTVSLYFGACNGPRDALADCLAPLTTEAELDKERKALLEKKLAFLNQP
jgi:COX assembly protein 1